GGENWEESAFNSPGRARPAGGPCRPILLANRSRPRYNFSYGIGLPLPGTAGPVWLPGGPGLAARIRARGRHDRGGVPGADAPGLAAIRPRLVPSAVSAVPGVSIAASGGGSLPPGPEPAPGLEGRRGRDPRADRRAAGGPGTAEPVRPLPRLPDRGQGLAGPPGQGPVRVHEFFCRQSVSDAGVVLLPRPTAGGRGLRGRPAGGVVG